MLAARAVGVRRYLQQLSGFFLKARGVLADESDGLAIDASAGVARSAQMYAELESRLERTELLECVGLRYGFFYGPRTRFNPDGAAADQVRRQEIPIVGEGIKASGPGSTSRTRPRQPRRPSQLLPGFRTLSTTTPPRQSWLPEFARFLGAPPPPRIIEQQARDASGEFAVYFGTKHDDASNEKAKKTFGFAPRWLEWLAK